MLKVNSIFGMPVSNVIKNRVSVRTYKEQELSDRDRDKIVKFISTVEGPFRAKVRYELIESKDISKGENIKLGTYGVIKGTSTFLLSAAEKGKMDLEQLGYTFEKIVLYCTSIGIGTCWMAGTFKRGEFAKAIKLRQNEMLTAISPLGYASEKRSFIDSAVRLTAGSKKRKEWEELFFEGDFDKSLENNNSERYCEALEMVRIAPSASNLQPWRIVKQKNEFHFFLKGKKGYNSAFGFNIQRIDIGIAMCHFELCMQENGIQGSWRESNPNLEKVPADTEYIISWIMD